MAYFYAKSLASSAKDGDQILGRVDDDGHRITGIEPGFAAFSCLL
jgi:hypothetical protein